MTSVDLPAPTGGILHIGCGDALAWGTAPRNGADPQLVLVEPNPACRASLAPLAARPGVQVIEAAICGAEAEDSFRVLNAEEYSLLGSEAPLRALLPGLEVEEHLTVACLTPEALMARAGLEGSDNLLILEALGQERAILEELGNGGGLGRFSRLIVHAPRQALFDAAGDAEALRALLLRHGFAHMGDAAAGDPDWSVAHFCRDDAVAALRRSRSDLQYENERVRLQVETLKEHAREGDAALAAAQARIAELSGARDAAETRAAGLAEAQEAARLQHAAQLQEQAQEIEGLRARLQEQGQRLEGVIGARDAAETRISELQAALEAAEDPARFADYEKRIARLEERLTDRQERQAQLQDQLGLAMQLQAKAGLDLEEMRSRHAETVAQKGRQEELLARLMARLEDASQYLQVLQSADASGPLIDQADAAADSAPPATKTTSRKRSPTKSTAGKSRSRKKTSGSGQAEA